MRISRAACALLLYPRVEARIIKIKSRLRFHAVTFKRCACCARCYCLKSSFFYEFFARSMRIVATYSRRSEYDRWPSRRREDDMQRIHCFKHRICMSGDRYLIQDQHGYHFLTITVVGWVDIFSRDIYRNVITESLNYCVDHKGMEINAWVLMSNHLHLVCRSKAPFELSSFLRDFKSFTSRTISGLILLENESRKKWMLNVFQFEAKRTGRAKHYKIWQDSNRAIDLNDIDAITKINYIHENPVENGIVREVDHYMCSSALDYAGGTGLVKVVRL